MSAEPVDDLPDELRALFAEERPLVALPTDARARLAHRLATAVAHGPTPSWLERAARGRWLWSALAFGAGVGIGGAVEHARRAPELVQSALATATPSSTETAVFVTRPLAAPGASAWVPVAVGAPAAPVGAPSARLPAGDAPQSASVRARSRTSSSLNEERVLVETARAALTRGRWDEAASALDRHAAAFPHGQLAEERDSVRVALLAVKGDASGAQGAALRFERDYPASFFLPAVRAARASVTEATDAGQEER